jgi:hypothetical protein
VRPRGTAARMNPFQLESGPLGAWICASPRDESSSQISHMQRAARKPPHAYARSKEAAAVCWATSPHLCYLPEGCCNHTVHQNSRLLPSAKRASSPTPFPLAARGS